jgi:hypothetical protein
MKVTRHYERFAVVLRPEAGDDPSDLEDLIHDEVVAGRVEGQHGSRVKVIVLDVDGVKDAPVWMKTAGPQLPDVNLRLALGQKGYLAANLLGLPAFFEFYPSVELALTGGV